MKILSIFFILVCQEALQGQTVITGTFTDSQTNLPVEYVNLGIPGKTVGTVSDESGTFTVVIPEAMAADTLRFSKIGYRPGFFLPSSSNGPLTVQMKRAAVQLKEVSVSPKKGVTEKVGNVTKSRSVNAYFKNNLLGSEFAIRLKIKEPGTQITKFFVNIPRCKIEDVVFRLNVYQPNPDGSPGENILKDEILVRPKRKTGMLEADLRPYRIFVDGDVFIAIEWIKDMGVENLSFSAKLFEETYYRQGSLGYWSKVGLAGVGLHAEVTY
jgi:hypothetical protein